MVRLVKAQLSTFDRNYSTLLNGKGISRLKAYTEWAWCALRHGASADDFFRYRLYEKSDYERKKFITYGRSKKIIRSYNSPDRTAIFNDKPSFNRFFAKFVKREWIEFDGGSRKEVENFISRHGRVIVKPVDQGSGRGIYLTDSPDVECRAIIEQIITQHPAMSKINPSSVNTVRVVTFSHGSTVYVISCALRTGVMGAPVDNLHSNDSQCWAVDPATGIVMTPSFGYSYRSSIFHLGSGVQVLGMRLPHWQEAIGMVKEAAMMIPEVGYVGWDVAIMPDGVQLIEGNHDPGHDLMQMIDNVGKYELIKRIIKNSQPYGKPNND